VADETETTFEGWAVLELMGHRRLAGYVTEVELAGKGMLRLDVPGPDDEPAASQLYSPAALYCLTPTTEDVARSLAARNQPEPVHRWELPAPAAEHDDIDFDAPGMG
jgi:hypothetical protein